MSAEWGPPPFWFEEDRPGPYLLSLCAAGEIAPALDALQRLAVDSKFRDQRLFGDNAARLVADCGAAEAWSLWRKIRGAVENTDVYFQPLNGPRTQLLICDMDMTIVAAETLDEVAAALGLGDAIASITARAMHGELDFDAALRERIAMLGGRPEQVFHEVARELEFNPGAAELIAGARDAGVHTILVSGGFAQVADAVGQQLGFDEVHCNRLEIEGERLTGKVVEPIVNATVKHDILERRARALGIGLDSCCAIGDGANDIPMIAAAGLGIAWRGKPVLRAAANCQLNHAGLDAALHFMRL